MLKQKIELSFIISAVAAFALSVVVLLGQVSLLDQNRVDKFEGDCELVVKLFTDHLRKTTERVKSLQAYYMARRGEVSRQEFEEFSKAIQEGQGHIRALEWIPILAADKKSAWEEFIHKEGYPDFKIYEKKDGKRITAEGRDLYYPVSFIYPMEGNRAAHGFDLGSNEKRKAAIVKCLSEEKTVATAPITLVQDNGSSSAVLLFLPVYKKGEALGLVLAVVEAARYLPEEIKKYLSKDVDYALLDKNSSVLMSTNLAAGQITKADYEKSFAFGRRRWSLSFVENGPSAYASLSVWLISLAVFAFLMVLILYLFKFKNYAAMVAEEVRVKTLECHDARDKAEQANQAKSTFLANMSHEIRTPMTAILGYVDYLKENKVDEEELDESFRVIRSNGEHLLSVINDVLDLSKIEALKMSTVQETVSPVGTSREIFSLFSSQHSKEAVDLKFNAVFPLPESFISDSVRIKQILLNLLSNAVKFTEKGFVELKLSYEEQSKTLSFSVSDSGIGMTEQQQSRVFAAFEQAHEGISRQFGGTGLGMMISSKLSTLLKGDLTVKSCPGLGSTFTLSFSLRDEAKVVLVEEEGAQFVKPLESVHLESVFEGKVLVVEDNVTNQKLLRKVLEKKGLEVDSAYDGLEGVCKSRENSYDLIFMDMQMPKMNGQMAFKEIREFDSETPIVALTANAFDSDRDECLSLGFNAFVSKPINKKSLLKVLQDYLT